MRITITEAEAKTLLPLLEKLRQEEEKKAEFNRGLIVACNITKDLVTDIELLDQLVDAIYSYILP